MSTPNKPTEAQPIEVPAFVARAAQRFSVEHDKPSFEILARAVQPSLEKATFYKDVPVGDIGPIVNRTLLVLWNRRESFNGTYGDFLVFGYEIVRREVFKHWRSELCWKRTTRVSREVVVSCAGRDDGDETAASPEDIAAAHEIFDRLPHREKCVVRARGEGQSWEEIAEDEGVSVARVRAIHARAVRRMREEETGA